MIVLQIGRLWRSVVLRLSGGQVESLFDLGLPACVAELPADLAVVDVLLAEPGVLAPIEASWAEDAAGFGRPAVAELQEQYDDLLAVVDELADRLDAPQRRP
jgi:hypothetical protein